MTEKRPSLLAFIRPYEPFHDVYQKYYQEGLRRHCQVVGIDFRVKSLSPFPRLLGALRHARDRSFVARLPGANRVLDLVGNMVEGPMRTPSGFFQTITGQYLLYAPSRREYRFCIDAADSHEIASEELREWSDVYFKTNFWPSADYAQNVMPLANVDPLVLGRIPGLRRYRQMERDLDLCFVVRVWGGRDEREGIEHNLRLLRAVSRARCRKFVLAVVRTGDVEDIFRSLRREGISATTRGLSAKELWRLTGRARLNVIRLGLHYCVPWRVTGALAMGSCLVLDRTPLSRWPEPLVAERNYLTLGTTVGPQTPVAAANEYEEIPERIERWLADPALRTQVELANADYFDGFLDPERLGAQIIDATGLFHTQAS